MSQYKYWMPVAKDEHRLYASEVAKMWGIYSINDKPHIKMITTILSEEEYFARQNPLYFQTRNGLVRCFGHDIVLKGYHRMITFSEEKKNYSLYENNGHKFKYITKEVEPWMHSNLEI